MSDLLDINVWLALIDKRHIHHPAASRYWTDSSVRSRAFCRVTSNGFLRLCTQARALSNPLSPHEAWITYRQFLSLPIIGWLSEPPGLDDRYCALSCAPGFAHHLWTDAYLAAFAMVSNCRLVSFDGNFKRFTGLDFLHLAPRRCLEPWWPIKPPFADNTATLCAAMHVPTRTLTVMPWLQPPRSNTA